MVDSVEVRSVAEIRVTRYRLAVESGLLFGPGSFEEASKDPPVECHRNKVQPRSSSREDRIRVPTFSVIYSRGTLPQKAQKGTGGPSFCYHSAAWASLRGGIGALSKRKRKKGGGIGVHWTMGHWVSSPPPVSPPQRENNGGVPRNEFPNIQTGILKDTPS